MKSTTIQIRVDDVLREHVQARGGAEYVRALIEQREAEVTGALGLLESAGWDRPHIRQAVGALDGAQHTHAVFGGGLWAGLGLAIEDAQVGSDGRLSGRPSNRVAIELHDAARLGRIDVDADAWGAMLETVRARADVALALQALARDYWSIPGAHPVIDEEDAALGGR